MGITIEIDNLAGIDYLEYYITGFWLLKEKGIIDQVKITFGTDTWGQKVRPGYVPYYKKIFRLKGGQAFPSLIKPLTVADRSLDYLPSFYLFGRITDGNRSKRFVIDAFDTPWDYRFIEDADFYFKSQYPKTFSEGYVDLNRNNRFAFSEHVITNSRKVRPLILGRPLGRVLDFSLNKRLLNHYARLRSHTKRNTDLLVFWGTLIDHRVDLDPSIHHPSIKRAELATWVHGQISGSKTILSLTKEIEEMGILSAETLSLKNKVPVTDGKYQKLMRDSFATFNITGVNGSMPWRILDGFMSGMLPISDNFLVDWYEPLIPGKDFLSIGDLGYELLEDVDIEDSFSQLKEYVASIESYFFETAQYRTEKYNDFYSPEMVAFYMLREMGFL